MLGKVWKNLNLPKSWQLFIMRRVQDEFLIGVTGIFFDENGRVFLVKHTYRGGWSLPGGYIKAGEHPGEGLEREVMEETNLIVSVDGPIKIRTDREQARLDIIYYGTYIGGVFEASREVKKYKLYDFAKLPRLKKDQLYFIDRARRLREFDRMQVDSNNN